MTRRLYLMRHGYTVFNQLDKLQGWSDSPLTELGVSQALELGEHLHGLGLAFDHAYSSPSERAWRSLMIALPELGMPTLDRALRELNCGSLEGSPTFITPWPVPDDHFVQFGGESTPAMRERVCEGLDQVMSRDGHELVVAASHGAAIRAFFDAWAAFSRVDPQELIGNCGCYAFEYDESERTFSCFDVWAPANQPQKAPAIMSIKAPSAW